MSDETKTATPAGTGPSLPQIASRFVDRPLLVTPHVANVFLYVLQNRLGFEVPNLGPAPEATAFRGSRARTGGRYGKLAAENGVGFIRIAGELVNRGEWIGSYSNMVAYEGIEAQIRDAKNDPEVSSVILDIDSPGGEAGGMIGLAQQVRELAATKPTVAFINDMAASAAYGIASQANEIVGTPTMSVGSIGVVMVHLDHSKMLAERGISPTLIYRGARKVDGNPFEPLPADVKARFEEECEQIYTSFVGLVAEGRGMSEEAIRQTEARIFIGQKAVEAGLADRIASVDEVIADLSQKAGSATQPKEPKMANETETNPTASADNTAAINDAKKAGAAEGAAAASSRISAILGSEEAKGREDAAKELAFNQPEMSSEAAVKLLATMPKAEPEAKTETTKTPTIEERASGEELGEEGKEVDAAASAKAMWREALADVNKPYT